MPSGEHYDGTSSKPVEATIPITEAMLGGETFHCMAVNIIDGVEYMTTKIIRIEVFKAFSKLRQVSIRMIVAPICRPTPCRTITCS